MTEHHYCEAHYTEVRRLLRIITDLTEERDGWMNTAAADAGMYVKEAARADDAEAELAERFSEVERLRAELYERADALQDRVGRAPACDHNAQYPTCYDCDYDCDCLQCPVCCGCVEGAGDALVDRVARREKP